VRTTGAAVSATRFAVPAAFATVDVAAARTGSVAAAADEAVFLTGSVAFVTVRATGWTAWVTVFVTGALVSAPELALSRAGWVAFTAVVTGSAAFDVAPVTASVTGATDSVVSLTAEPTPPSTWPEAGPVTTRAERIAPSKTAGRRIVAADNIMGLKAVYPEALAG
jgi:hypothetical protein